MFIAMDPPRHDVQANSARLVHAGTVHFVHTLTNYGGLIID